MEIFNFSHKFVYQDILWNIILTERICIKRALFDNQFEKKKLIYDEI